MNRPPLFTPLYRICGVTLRSELPLPADELDGGEADIAVTLRAASIPRLSPGPWPFQARHLTPDGLRLEYLNPDGETLRFTVSADGTRIAIETSFESEQGLAYILLGLPLAAALFFRGAVTLHGSAVVLDGRAVLVAGRSGSGKSTTTAAAMAAGAALLSDDLCTLTPTPSGWMVEPGYPWLRLSPDTGLMLGLAAAELPRIFGPANPDDKRWVDSRSLPAGFHPCAAPLAGICVLAGPRRKEAEPSFRALTPAEGCAVLEPHGFGWKAMEQPKAASLATCARIASRVPVFRVRLPEGLDAMLPAARVILRHVTRAGDPGPGQDGSRFEDTAHLRGAAHPAPGDTEHP